MGKTTVLNIFKNLGAHTINADELVSELLKNPVIINKLLRTLGKKILIRRGGKVSMNKKRIADIIFNNAQKRILTEKIIHAEVIKAAIRLKTKITGKNPAAIIVFEVPLLFESHYEKIFDKIIVIYCNKATATRRLVAKGFFKKEVIKRLRAQMPISRKKTSADFLINNNSTIDALQSRVHAIFKKLNYQRVFNSCVPESLSP